MMLRTIVRSVPQEYFYFWALFAAVTVMYRVYGDYDANNIEAVGNVNILTIGALGHPVFGMFVLPKVSLSCGPVVMFLALVSNSSWLFFWIRVHDDFLEQLRLHEA